MREVLSCGLRQVLYRKDCVMQSIIKEDSTVITKPEDDFIDRLMDWNLTVAMARVRKELRLPENEYAELELEYKRYMAVLVSNPGLRMTPSELIDEVWHAHILHTEDYFAFCKAFNRGRYVHHRPETNQAILVVNQTDNMMPRYRAMFGEPNRKFWPVADLSMCDGNGTGCEAPRSMPMQGDTSMCDGEGGGSDVDVSTGDRMRALSMCDGDGGNPDAGDDQ